MAAAALVVLTAQPCVACSCQWASDEEHFERAEVVFTGTSVSRNDPNPSEDPYDRQGDSIEWIFDVESVQKGTASSTQSVWSVRESSLCGVSFNPGTRYQVFAYERDGAMWDKECGGTRNLAVGREAYAPQGHHAPADPSPAPSPSPILTPAPTPSPAPSPPATPKATQPPATAPAPASTAPTPTPEENLASERTGAGNSWTVQMLALGLGGLALAGAGYTGWRRIRT